MPPFQPDLITVEVAYALPHRQTIISLTVNKGTTALEAILQSGILEKHPEISVPEIVLGIFGKQVSTGKILQAMDRVEIYRPLLANPKEARRQRAAAKNSTAKNRKINSG